MAMLRLHPKIRQKQMMNSIFILSKAGKRILEVEAQFEEHLKTVSDVSVPNSSEPEKEVSSPASEISENSSTSSQPESSVPESSVEESRNNVSTGQSDDISLLLLIFVLSLAIGTVGIMTGKNSYSRRKNK